MKISLNWIKDYVEFDLPLRELLDRLTMIGLVAESVEEKDGDTILELETYANRPDTLGHLGVAREIAAMLGLPLAEPSWPLTESDPSSLELADVQILDEGLCPRYCGMIVRDVTVGPSPDWLRKRLEAIGLRPINNVVDASNYVLFATGQPIHAFDFRQLSGSKILVRKANRGERMRDLEGRTLELGPEMLVIADETRPVALAGIIGGEGSAVSGTTRDVFIESANFDPISIRLTSKKLGLATDASYRYERGADIGILPKAALMMASLLTQMGGVAARGVVDVYPKPRKAKSAVLRARRVGELLGVDVPEDFIQRVLASLGFRMESSQKGLWLVEIPSFRVDIDREADLIEEIARFYGYDRIPSAITPAKSFEFVVNRKRERVLTLRQTLLERGFDEVINFSFADPEKEAVLQSGREPVKLRNPISARASVLRTNLLMGLLENAAWNRNRGLEGVHIFEVGNIYFCQGEKPEERLTLGLLTTGLFPGRGWQEKPAETDFYVLKGALEAVTAALRYEPCSFEGAAGPYFEEGQGLTLVYKGQPVGRFGVLKASIAAHDSIDRPVFAAEIDLAGLFEKQSRPFAYVPVPKFPGVSRDLSFLVDRNVPYQEIQKTLDRLAPPLLEGYELRDRFSGPSIPTDRVSLTIRFRYRHPKRTLLAEEVDRVEQEIVGQLKSVWNIQLREGSIDNRT
jgi:phenylalanyl-tRNA synthetase beta chain